MDDDKRNNNNDNTGNCEPYEKHELYKTQKISIIVPVYNAETTLERCVDALVNQTYQNIEIILVNDGSQDNSSTICHRYADADERIIVIDKENGGVSSARNAGLDMAIGEYVMFCDSDDWAEPNWCEMMIGHFEPDCLIMCGTIIEGCQPYLPREVRANGNLERYERSECCNLKMKLFNAPWNKMFKRRKIEDNCLRFNTSLTNGEDLLFNINYLNCISGDILLLDSCGIHYSWPNDNSLSKVVPDNYFEQLEIMNGLLEDGYCKLRVASRDAWKHIYTDMFNEYAKGILPIIKSKNISLLDKRKRLKRVMDSDNYCRCVKHATVSSNKLYSALWKNHLILGLMCWHLIR